MTWRPQPHTRRYGANHSSANTAVALPLLSGSARSLPLSVWVSRSVDTAARERVCLRDQRIRSSAQLGVGGAASCGQRKQLLARKDVEANGEASAVVRAWWARARCGSAVLAMAGAPMQRTRYASKITSHLHQNRYVLIYCTARMTALPDYASTMHAPSHTSTEAIASRLDAGRARARRRRNAC